MKDKYVILNMSENSYPKQFTETNRYNNKYINFGEDNDYPNHLIHLFDNSALHNAICISKHQYISGSELYSDETNKKTKDFINMTNSNGETLYDVYSKCVFDYIIFGGFYLNVVWDKLHKTIAELYHIDFNKIRVGAPNLSNKIDTLYYSNDWMNTRQNINKPIMYPAFDVNDPEYNQIMYCRPFRPGSYIYPKPSYIGSIPYIEVDYEISQFHLANIKNGMNPSIMITFTNGTPEEEERADIIKNIKKNFSGSRNTGNIMVMFAENNETQPVITTYAPSQLDKQFIQLQSSVLQNILSGHRIVSPLLVGIKESGQLGGTTELETSYMLYKNSVIQPEIDIMMKFFNKLGSINGASEIKVNELNPISFNWSENILDKIMTMEEKREKVGLEPLQIEPTQNNKNNIQ